MYITTAETEDYALVTCRRSNQNILRRKVNDHYCIIDDLDANILTEVIDYDGAFDKIASSFTFIDPFTEKQMYDGQ